MLPKFVMTNVEWVTFPSWLVGNYSRSELTGEVTYDYGILMDTCLAAPGRSARVNEIVNLSDARGAKAPDRRAFRRAPISDLRAGEVA